LILYSAQVVHDYLDEHAMHHQPIYSRAMTSKTCSAGLGDVASIRAYFPQ